ncbi:MAG: hypothetical protein S4CHLAM27_04380 [Chlamydiia bacterium]|nr:hypothetical protein [Chlamydiia bacterium]
MDISGSGGAKEGNKFEGDEDFWKKVPNPLKSNRHLSSKEFIICALQSLRETFVKEYLSKDQRDKKPFVAIVLQPKINGGDISFAHKAALGFIKRGCKVEINVCCSPALGASDLNRDASSVKRSLLSLLPDSDNFTVKTPEDARAERSSPDCVLIAPQMVTSEELKKNFSNLVGIPNEHVMEYGFEMKLPKDGVLKDIKDVHFASGLGVGQFGIFQQDGEKKALSEKERIEKFTQLCEKDPERCSVLLQGKSSKEYLKTNKLYFAYAHLKKSMSAFLDTVAYLNKEAEEQTIDIIIPWRRKAKTSYSIWSNIEPCSYDKIKLQRAGIGRVEIIDKDGKEVDQISASGEGKVLRIINVFPLPKESFDDFLAVSEEVCLITGDQSWTEAALDPSKIMLYETQEWKKKFYKVTKKIAEKEEGILNVMHAWERYGGRAVADAVKGVLPVKKSGVSSSVTRYHASLLTEKKPLEKRLFEEAVRLAASKNDPTFGKKLAQLEGEFLKRLQVREIIESSRELLLVFLNIFNWLSDNIENGKIGKDAIPYSDILDELSQRVFEELEEKRELWKSADKSSLPEDKVKLIDKTFALPEEFQNRAVDFKKSPSSIHHFNLDAYVYDSLYKDIF